MKKLTSLTLIIIFMLFVSSSIVFGHSPKVNLGKGVVKQTTVTGLNHSNCTDYKNCSHYTKLNNTVNNNEQLVVNSSADNAVRIHHYNERNSCPNYHLNNYCNKNYNHHNYRNKHH